MIHKFLSASPKQLGMHQYEVALVLCLVFLNVVSAEKLSVSELLDKYAANQDKLKSFIMIADINYEDLTENKTASHFNKREIIEFRYEDDDDGFRAYYCPKHVHSAVDESLVIADHTFLWDCERFIEHQKAPTLDKSVAFVSFSTNKIKDAIGIPFAGPGSILGFLYGDVERFDSILRQADSISMRDELERVGSGDCYVIDAKTKHGTYKIWLDPERGYGIAKADIHKGPKDLWYGRPLDYFTHAPYMPNVISIRNVRFESIEGIWVPMEVDFRVDSKDLKGSNRSSVLNVRNVHYKVTELLLNPDHDALGSFVPDIKNGTTVHILGVPGIKYKWQNGKLVPDVDKYIIDEIDRMTEEIMAEGEVPAGLATAKKTEAAQNLPAGIAETHVTTKEAQGEILSESRPFPVLVLIPIGLLIIVVLGWAVFRRLKA